MGSVLVVVRHWRSARRLDWLEERPLAATVGQRLVDGFALGRRDPDHPRAVRPAAAPDQALGRQLLHRIGRAVATAATGRLPFSVGQVIYVDGGLSQWSY